MVGMVRCKNAGNMENFRREYFRPPITVKQDANGEQRLVIYRCGKASADFCEDIYSSKRTQVNARSAMALEETSAFGAIVLRGYGDISLGGKTGLEIASASVFETRDDAFADEFFVSANAAKNFKIACNSSEPLVIYQHFASGSNPAASTIKIPEYTYWN